MKSQISKGFGWLSAIAALFCLGLQTPASAQQGCDLSFSPNPATLSSYVTVYPGFKKALGAQQQLTSYFAVEVTNIVNHTNYPNPPIPYGVYPSWCIDQATFITTASVTIPGTLFQGGKLYSSCDPNLNSELPPGHPNTLVSAATWQMVNYLLNYHTIGGSNVFYWDLQAAINTLVGSAVGSPNPCGGVYTTPTPTGGCDAYPVYNPAVVQELLEAATNNAAEWVPQCGQVLGAIYVTSPTNQFILVPVPVPCSPCIGVTKTVACMGPTNSCGSFGPSASGYVGAGCSGVNEPAFCYQISITNCGTIPLTNVVVYDNLLGTLTTNFFTSPSEVFWPGSNITAVFSMSFAANATNTVIVTGDASLSQTVTNGGVVYTNGSQVSANSSAVALIDTASVNCGLSVTSPSALSNSTPNNLILPSATYYSTSNAVTLTISVTNTGAAALNDVALNIPSLAQFSCGSPAPFNLAAGASTNIQLCFGLVTCPAQLNMDVTVTATVSPDTNHCGIYTLGGNQVSVCSSCLATVSCSTGSGCLAGTANIGGMVALDCSPNSGSIAGDSGIPGIPVILYGASSNALATNVTDINGDYSFSGLASGIYTVQVVAPTNYIQDYPAGNTNSEVTISITPCIDQTNINFGFADTTPPVIAVPPGGSYGCNPVVLPTDSSIATNITVSSSCGAVSTNISHVDTNTTCSYTRVFTITATDSYGNTSTSYVTDTWTVANLTFASVPPGTNYGCNPLTTRQDSDISNAVTYLDSCSSVTNSVTHTDTNNGCAYTRIFTIVAGDTCGDTASTSVTDTWTVATLKFNTVPAGTNYGCNPTSMRSDSDISNAVTYSDSCSTVSSSVTHQDNNSGCSWTRVFTISATDTCGDSVSTTVTDSWTIATLTFASVPASTNLGCNPTTILGDTDISNVVTYNDTCSTVASSVTHTDTNSGCSWTRVFTISASDTCGDTASTTVTETWTTATLTFATVPANTNLGCNPASIPADTDISNLVSYNDTCSTVSSSVTHADTNNGCSWTRVFTISATDTCGDSVTTNVTATWTTATLSFSSVPANTNLGCNPTSIPADTDISNAVTYSDNCSAVTSSVTHADTNSGCNWTRVFTINASDSCGDTATASVTDTWTVATLKFASVPANTNLGCNPASIPSDSTISNAVTYNDTCSTVTSSVTHQDNNSGCNWTRVFTISATDTCGDSVSTTVTDSWSTATLAFATVPASTNLGCNPTSLPTDSSISNAVTYNDTCSTVTSSVTHIDTNSGCSWTRVFTISASDTCGDTASTTVTETWTTATLTFATVPANTNLGCNPASIPTDSSISNAVSYNDTCSTVTSSVTHADTNNSCSWTRVFTISATDTCGDSVTTNVTATWTTATLAFATVPASTNLGCNPTSIPTDSSISNAVSTTDTCSAVADSVTHTDTNSGCNWTRVFVISASDSCGDSATASVTDTWTVATLKFASVPASTNLGCNPANIPSDSSISNAVTYNDTCSTVTSSVTHKDSSSGCNWTRVFTISATDTCGDSVSTTVTDSWTTATLTFASVPASTNLGCNPASLPTDSSISNAVSYNDSCSTVSSSVTHQDSNSGCNWTRIFTISATDTCGDSVSTTVTDTWSTATLAFATVPASTNLGCNPASIPSDSTISNAVTYNDSCSTVTGSVTHKDSSSGCNWTRVFTISATDTCGDSVSTTVTDTWTTATLVFATVPASTNLGCNPTSLPTDSSISNAVSTTDTCSAVADSVTHVDTNSGCSWTRVFTIKASDTCGDSATALVTDTWTTATLAFAKVPASTNLGCNPPSIPSDSSISNAVTYNDTCSTVTGSVSHKDSSSGCNWTRVFTISATDTCGDSVSTTVTDSWTTATLTFASVPASTNLGCNPASLPTDSSISNAVSYNDSCSTVTGSVTHQDSNSGCNWTRVFTISASDTCGDTVSTTVTDTWSTATLTLTSVPVGTNLGCNPTNIPTTQSIASAVQVSDTCSTPGVNVTCALSTNSCAITQVFTIVVTDTCKDSATAYVTNTWTSDTTKPLLSGVPAGTNYGCNPASILTVAQLQAAVKATDTCSQTTVNVTAVTSTNGCAMTEVFTILATNACGNSATAYVTNTWTADTAKPILSGIPAGTNYGCNPTNVLTIASLQGMVKASDTCSPATINITGGATTNGCAVTQTFTIIATNACGNSATAYLTNTWTYLPPTILTNISYITNVTVQTNYTYVTNTAICTNVSYVTNIVVTTNTCTNAICGTFNWGNPSSGWLWLNCHIAANPGSNCTIYCTGGSVTLGCISGHSYSYPIPNGTVCFSSSCTTATNWYDGTNWHTTLPCSGDDQIFSQGCPIPWQSDFASCQSVCVTATYCSTTPGLTCNWQWGASCYSGSTPACGQIVPKACHSTPCQSGQYYYSSDYAGCPEGSQKPNCVSGGTGWGYPNCTGSWTPNCTTCQFGLTTNKTVTPMTTYTTNTTIVTNKTTTPITTITTNSIVTSSISGPVLSGVPVGTNFGCNPASVPTPASVQALITASQTCSSPSINVTGTTATNGCIATQIFTIVAANACGGMTTVYVTNTWTVDKVPPVITGLPTSTFLGCTSGTNLPGDANILAVVKATDSCSTPSITVTHVDTTNGCTGTRTFTITAADACGNVATTNLVYSWTGHTPDYCTNSLCAAFNSKNPGSGWLWLNANCSGNPGQNCTLYCQGATVTLNCTGGKTYTYPVPNGTINFSSSCNVATNWFDGTNWNTTLPCAGDSQIFLAGCAIPWQSNFASCQSVCWTGVFSCSTPGLAFNWQWGAACFGDTQPAYTNICPKACYQTSCPNGQYYQGSDFAGCPESHKPYCVAGGTGLGGTNCTGNWSGVDTTCTFSAGTSIPPVLNGIPANDNLGLNPTNIPTIASVLAEVTATDTCSPAPVSVTMCLFTNSCTITQIFNISATNDCGQYATAGVTNTWTTLMCTNHCTNTVCSGFVSSNPGGGWMWLNCQMSGKPGTNEILVTCTNASVTLSCTDGKTYTFPVPNGTIHFSPSCTTATNWFDGTNWFTTLPCSGDDQIFLSGCAIPWQSDFAGCRSACWTGDFSCSQPGCTFNWQFGAACYSDTQPTPSQYGTICPKACHQTTCPNGYYFHQSDCAGTPESHNPYCVSGGTGYGGSSWTGGFSNPGSCSF